MDFEWDDEKRTRNLEKHEVDFGSFAMFDWDTALTLEDERFTYGERRYVSIGKIANRIFVAVWTERSSNLRLISLRKANKREVRRYDES